MASVAKRIKLSHVGSRSLLPLRPAAAAQRPSFPRFYATEQQPPPRPEDQQPAKGPNQDVLGHVSEEAAAVGKVTGEEGPDVTQGTPITEVLQRDGESTENMPEVIRKPLDQKVKEAADADSSARVQALFEGMYEQQLLKYQDASAEKGLKFELPELPLPPGSHLKHRYEPIVDQITNLLMVDGKKASARRNVSLILKHLQTSPAPRINPARPLLPSTPPAQALPFQPILYLQSVIDSVAPVLRLRQQKGMIGGGQLVQMPVPLTLKQRRRKAFMWILDTVNKKRSQGSGKGQLAKRVAEEIISVAEGRSNAWEKRAAVHKQGITSRGNLKTGRRAGRR